MAYTIFLILSALISIASAKFLQIEEENQQSKQRNGSENNRGQWTYLEQKIDGVGRG